MGVGVCAPYGFLFHSNLHFFLIPFTLVSINFTSFLFSPRVRPLSLSRSQSSDFLSLLFSRTSTYAIYTLSIRFRFEFYEFSIHYVRDFVHVISVIFLLPLPIVFCCSAFPSSLSSFRLAIRYSNGHFRCNQITLLKRIYWFLRCLRSTLDRSFVNGIWHGFDGNVFLLGERQKEIILGDKVRRCYWTSIVFGMPNFLWSFSFLHFISEHYNDKETKKNRIPIFFSLGRNVYGVRQVFIEMLMWINTSKAKYFKNIFFSLSTFYTSSMKRWKKISIKIHKIWCEDQKSTCVNFNFSITFIFTFPF